MSYQIITDSSCDFTKEKYEALGLIAAPLTVNFRGETYPDRNDDSLRDMYADLRAGEAATTSAVNPEQWQEIMHLNIPEIICPKFADEVKETVSAIDRWIKEEAVEEFMVIGV